MDKRWILIIIILIAGLSCMYYIASSSTTVGSAVTIVDDLSVTLPHDFKISDSETESAALLNERTNASIFIKYLSDGNNSLKEYKKEVKSLSYNENIEILDNESNKTNHFIYYTDYRDGNNYSLYYVEKFDRTLLIKAGQYDDVDQMKSDVEYIVSTLKPDYKQNRS